MWTAKGDVFLKISKNGSHYIHLFFFVFERPQDETQHRLDNAIHVENNFASWLGTYCMRLSIVYVTVDLIFFSKVEFRDFFLYLKKLYSV